MKKSITDFNDIAYERVSYENTKDTLHSLIEKLSFCNKEEFMLLSSQIISIQNHIEEMYDYADIRNMRDMDDAFFQEEIEYWNTYKPLFDLLFLPFYESLLKTKYKEKLMEIFPSNFFTTIAYQSSITSFSIVALQQKENKLKTKYRNLNRNKILFDGEERTISYIASFGNSKDRALRKKAHDTLNDYYYEKREEYDTIFLELVFVRNEIARKLGFSTYVDYSLIKQRRFGYTYQDISKFRENICQYIVPICEKLSLWQKEELSLSDLKYYDTIFFENMPVLLYEGETLLEKTLSLLGNMDEDLSMLISSMLPNHYIDLLSREGKVNFAITNYLVETGMPVITGNFKNNYLDVQTISHELGHSFQKYMASIQDRDFVVSALLKYPTMEIAEMFSYGMELLSLPFVKDLFKEKDYYKYSFMKLYNLICNLPYICLIDEFQECIYSKEDLKKEDIRKIFIDLTYKYHLKRVNQGHILLDSGGYFYRQSHIYLDPFYYIDYALSYFGAFALWDNCKKDLNKFKEIGSVASYYSFSTLIQKYDMPNPFDEKVVRDISCKLYNELVYYKKKI